MTNVTKEEYWTTILNDPTQIGQITTEDTEFNRRINDVNLVLSNTFINSSDENLISKWETSLYIDETEGKTITERKAEILYKLCEKNYVPVSIIKRFLLNLIGDENRFIVEFIKDENKLVIHTDRISDELVMVVSSLLESVVPHLIEVEQYNHRLDISWRDINKYSECVTVDDIKVVNPDYKNDVTSDGEWIYPLDSLENATGLFNSTTSGLWNHLKKARIYAPKNRWLKEICNRCKLSPLGLGEGAFLGQEEVGEDGVGYQEAFRAEAPTAIGQDHQVDGPILFQLLLNGVEAQQVLPLVFACADAVVGSQAQHQVVTGPLPDGDLLDILHDLAAFLNAPDVGHQVTGQDEALAGEVGAGVGAEAQIFAAGPVFQIVPGQMALPAEIGDLVLAEALVTQDLYGGQVHIRLGVIVRQIAGILNLP